MSQLLAALSAVIALAATVCLWRRIKRHPAPLYVDRLARQAARADAEVVKSDSTPGQSQDVQPTQGQMPDPPEVPEKKE